MTDIQAYEREKHGDAIAELWNDIFPTYQIPKDHLLQLLASKEGHHSVSTTTENGDVVAAAIAFKIEETGYLSAIFTRPSHRRQGHATALLVHVRAQLLHQHACESLHIGSVFPRFWCGVPTDFSDVTHRFFLDRGFSRFGDALAKDLHLDLAGWEPPPGMLERADASGLRFAPWTQAGYGECMSGQRANFGANAGWVAAYEALAAEGLHRQVMVAWDHDDGDGDANGDVKGRQVGWTLMVEPDLPVWNNLAFPRLLGARTALVACVGVDKAARRRGVGQALLVQALLDLRTRGVEHVFVDWVVLDDWYERLGFRTWRSYHPMKWNP